MNDQVPPTSSKPKLPPDIANLTRFPLPPSVNNLYISVGRKRVKAPSYHVFERMCLGWMRLHPRELEQARQLTIGTGPMRFIHIDTVFYMQRTRIFTKDGRPKRNDTSNRLKALHDALAKMLGIDDSYFWSCSADKVAVDDEADEGVDITMVISTYEERDCYSPRL